MDKRKSALSRGKLIKFLAVFSFSVVIAVVTTLVLTFYYKPSLNSLNALSTVSMDIICMIVIMILVGNQALEKDEIGKTTGLFITLMVGTIWALFLDFLNWAFDGELSFDNITFLFTSGSLCMGAVLAGAFVLYLANYLADMHGMKRNSVSAIICTVANALAFLISAFLAVTKQAFDYVDGHYVPGTLYEYVGLIPILTVIYMTVYSIVNVKKIGVHDVSAIAGYITFMVVGALIEGDYNIGTTYVFIAIADVYIFVMLQSRYLGQVKKQKDMLAKSVEKWIEKSNTDEVTGLFNRHAYEEAVSFIESNNAKHDLVYVSMDVNSLKIVNDTMGHDAGDELITGAAECMKKAFGEYGRIFRMGGDEFAALIYADDEELEAIKKNFKETMNSWSGNICEYLTISCGYVAQKDNENLSIHQMSLLADERMYADKANYYHKEGIDRRGQRDAHVALCDLYTRILKVNITTDKYQSVSNRYEAWTKNRPESENFSEWLKKFEITENIHPEDIDEFRRKLDLKNLSAYFKENKVSLYEIYRKKVGDTYKQVLLEIIPANDYMDKSQNLFLYIKNIE